jgi:hypothetical protein
MRRALVALRMGVVTLLLVLAMALGVLWPRTGRVGDSLNYVSGADTLYAIETVPGGISIARSTHEAEVTRAYPDEIRPAAGWSLRSMVWGKTYALETPDWAERQALASPYTMYGEFDEIVVQRPASGWWGFHWNNGTFTYAPPFTTKPVQVEYVGLEVPLWFAMAILITPAAWSVVGWWRRRRRTGAGHCPVCGYDLRATPERCPECGRATGVVMTTT